MFGGITGTFFIEDPNSTPAPDVKFSTGSTEFVITTSETNAQALPGQKFFEDENGNQKPLVRSK